MLILTPLLHCSPTVYTPPTTSSYQDYPRTIEYEQSVEDIWAKLTDYISQSSYGLDSLDVENYYAELRFESKQFHKFLDGGVLDEGGFNGYEGDLLELILPTDDFKTTLTCSIHIQLSRKNLSSTTLSYIVKYETVYAKRKKKVLSEYKFDSQNPIHISTEDSAMSYTIASSYLLEKQLYQTFSNFQ
tara:strand:- start:12033 stop:12593 length:561 start_codon:yes stop_codon:yes gene_type:complete